MMTYRFYEKLSMLIQIASLILVWIDAATVAVSLVLVLVLVLVLQSASTNS